MGAGKPFRKSYWCRYEALKERVIKMFIIKKILLLLCLSTTAHSVEFKAYPEYTGELKDFASNSQLLGIESDPERTLSKKASKARNFLMKLDLTVFQLHIGGCGAVFTSNQGYAVTALHCLEGLGGKRISPLKNDELITTKSGETINSNFSTQNMEGYEYTSWNFNKVRFPNHKEMLPLKLVALGKGYPDLKKHWRHTDEEIINNSKIISNYTDDYAIIKLNRIPQHHRCVKTAQKMPENGSLTWATGYPVHVRRKQTYLSLKTIDSLIFKAIAFAPEVAVFFRRAAATIRDYTNESWYSFETNQLESPFYIAVGRVFGNYSQLKKEFPYPINSQSDQLLDLVTDPQKYIVSTAFTKSGFSGGGLFNTNHELIAINSMSPAVLTFSEEKFQPMMSHVRIDYIKNQVREKLGQEMLNKIFNCEH